MNKTFEIENNETIYLISVLHSLGNIGFTEMGKNYSKLNIPKAYIMQRFAIEISLSRNIIGKKTIILLFFVKGILIIYEWILKLYNKND